jgi:hypothetical protein
MKEKPIIFSGPMVQALLNTEPNTWPAEAVDSGKPYKWMTRRVIKPRYKPGEAGFELSRQSLNIRIVDEEGMTVREDGPKYWPGDVLWVRETFTKTKGDYIYRSDPAFEGLNKGDFSWPWTSPLFLPRKAARLFLEVKAVRIERLQEITEEDANAEGVFPGKCTGCGACSGSDCYDPIRHFENLWETINAKRGYPWESNPWVWVYEFMRVKRGEEEHATGR